MIAAMLLAAYLHHPLDYVEKVYIAGGVDAVALVECESCFNPKAIRREKRGHTSWGFYQLDDEFHPQWRGNLLRHIAEGELFFEDCKTKARDFRHAVLRYNGSLTWACCVERKRNELLYWLRWRERRDLGVAQ